MIILALASILGYILFFNKIKLGPIEALPIFTVLLIISVLYISALCGSSYLIFSADLIFIIGCLLISIKLIDYKNLNKEFLNKNININININIIIFIILSLLLYLASKDSFLHSNDEFSHWGLIIKEMFYNNSLVNSNFITGFKDYPPGTALFQYYIARILGYTEGNVIFAQNIIVLSCLYSLFLSINKHNIKFSIITTVLFTYLALYSLGQGFNVLLIDHIVALVAASGYLIYLYSVRDINTNIKTIILMSVIIFCLPLIKAVGTLMAVFLILYIAIDKIIYLILNKDINLNKKIKNFITIIFTISLLFLVLFISKNSWTNYVKSIGANKVFATDFSIANIKSSISNSDHDSKDYKVITNFTKALYDRDIKKPGIYKSINKLDKKLNNKLNYIIFILLILLIAYLIYIYLHNKQYFINNRKFIILSYLCFFIVLYFTKITILSLILIFTVLHVYIHAESKKHNKYLAIDNIVLYINLLFCSIAFSIGLLLLYLYSFGEYEAVGLASFHRYSNIWLLLWAIVLFGLLSKLNYIVKSKKIIIGYILIFLLCASGRYLSFLFHPNNLLEPERKEVIVLADKVKRILANDNSKKVYFISQQSNGYELQMFKYEMALVVTSDGCWSIGNKYNNKDVWTCDLTVEEFVSKLQGYEYVVILNLDENFIDKYQEAFNGEIDSNYIYRFKNNKLYKV